MWSFYFALIIILFLTKPTIKDNNVKVATSVDIFGSSGRLYLERIKNDVKFQEVLKILAQIKSNEALGIRHLLSQRLYLGYRKFNNFRNWSNDLNILGSSILF